MSLKAEFGNGGAPSQLLLKTGAAGYVGDELALNGGAIVESSPASGIGGVIADTSLDVSVVKVNAAGGGSGTGGTVSVSLVNNSYIFQSSSWNGVKNAVVTSDVAKNIVLRDFVHADIDFSSVGADGNSRIELDNLKRGNILTGAGNDTVVVSLASNGADWQNVVSVSTGIGADNIVLKAGSVSGIAKITDGSFTSVVIDAGAGDDRIDLSGLKLKSAVLIGGTGNDTFIASNGSDVFVYAPTNEAAGSGRDMISGFQLGVDHIELKGGITVKSTVVFEGDLHVALSDNTRITLVGVEKVDASIFING